MLLDLGSKQTLHCQLFQHVEPLKHIHLVYLVHRGTIFNHLVIDEVCHSCEAYHPAICHEEDTAIDKEDINANPNLPLELN